MGNQPRQLRAAAHRNREDSSEPKDEELDSPQRQDEIRYPKPTKLKLHCGELEFHALGARAQRSFTGLAMRIASEARATMPGTPQSVAYPALLAAPRYFTEFLLYIVAALYPADSSPGDEQFQKMCAEMDVKLSSPMGVADLGAIFGHMIERYDIAKVIQNLPKI